MAKTSCDVWTRDFRNGDVRFGWRLRWRYSRFWVVWRGIRRSCLLPLVRSGESRLRYHQAWPGYQDERFCVERRALESHPSLRQRKQSEKRTWCRMRNACFSWIGSTELSSLLAPFKTSMKLLQNVSVMRANSLFHSVEISDWIIPSTRDSIFSSIDLSSTTILT